MVCAAELAPLCKEQQSAIGQGEQSRDAVAGIAFLARGEDIREGCRGCRGCRGKSQI
jgi:hypothetical protein